MKSEARVVVIGGGAVGCSILYHLTLARDGKQIEQAVTTGERPGTDGRSIGLLSVRAGETEYHRLDPFSAVAAGVTQTWDVTVQTLAGLWGMIAGGERAVPERYS